MKGIAFYLFVFMCVNFSALGKTVKYELVATKGKVNLSGTKEIDFALMINGTIPAPTLEFTEGDEAEIKLINQIPDDEVSIHWHGFLLDPFMDGVPYVNTPPIRPGESFTFKFKIRQHGTYWYHSHTGVQEQKGLYGGIIIHPRTKTIDYDKDLVLVVSDWTDEDANRVLANLRKDGDYYIFKKGTMRSYWGAIKEGKLKNFLYNEWTRMGGMDFSDVGYDAFLINGKKNESFMAHPGEKIRVRVINASASSYFLLALANVPMKVISVDGVDIEPTLASEILIGMAETYDILFQVPEHKNYEFKATVQDGTGSTSAWIGMGEKVHAPVKPKPDMYALMSHDAMGHGEHGTGHGSGDVQKLDKESKRRQGIDKKEMDHGSMDHSSMDHSSMDHGSLDHSTMDQKETSSEKNVVPVLTVNDIRSPTKTNFKEGIPRRDVTLKLDGDMDRYTWFINGKAIHEDLSLYINEGEVVRYTFVNKTMMHHPMHLHGHFFRVLNKHGEQSPLKHTVDVPPHTTRTIEFYADEPGEWMLHCHNLYHMKTGMGRVVRYSSFKPSPKIAKYQTLDPHLHDHLYYRGMIEGASNHGQAEFYLLKTRDELELRSEVRKDADEWEVEGDLFYKRWLSRYTHLVAGGTLVEQESAAVVGVGYILPMLIETHTIVDQKGRIRLNLEKRLQWTKYIFTDVEFTFRQKQLSEFEISLMYQRNWSWSAGLMFTEKTAGVGAQYNF